MKIQAYQLHRYVKAKYKLTEQELFDLPEGKRKVILDTVFNKFASHRLYRDGLTNVKNTKDKFDNYKSYSHLKNLEMVSKDINITKQKSVNKLAKWKRKIHLARKERFNARKRRKVREISEKEHMQKWELNNKVTKSRLERLRRIKENENSKEFER
jgi:hypothetical protein